MKAGGLGDASQFSGDLVGEPEVFHCVMALYGQRGLPRQASDGAKESQSQFLWWNWDAWIWIKDQNWYAWIWYLYIYVYIHTYIHKPYVVYFENIAGLFTCRFLNLDPFLSKKSSCLASWYDPWFKVERFPREAHETGCLTSKADGWGLVRYKVAWPASWNFWWSQLPNFNCSQSLPARE